MPQHIAIIGAGVIGAALAFRLQGPDCQVTVIDAGTDVATDASFGWINASFYLSEDHFRFRAAGMEAYVRLAAELDLPLRRCGCLNWEFQGAEQDAFQARLEALGYAVEQITKAEFQRREPAIANAPAQALAFPTEAVAEPAALRHKLIASAQAKGAKVLSGVRVTSLEGGVYTTAGIIPADQTVVTAGIGSAGLLDSIGVHLPMLHRPAYVVETTRIPAILTHVLAGPMGELRQRTDGALIAPAVVSHQSNSGDTADFSAPDAADATIARLRQIIPGHPFKWAGVTRAKRPVPGDNLPVIGAVRDGLYLATMHSGLTLGAITAELAAQEILQGPSNTTHAMLAGFRPDRFTDM